MKLTRILAALLALVMMLSLVACTTPDGGEGTTTAEKTPDTTTAPDETTTAAETTTEAGETTTLPAETTKAPESTTIPEDEKFVTELDGIFDDPTFSGGTSMFTKVNHGDVVIENGQLKVTFNPESGQINLQEWEHAPQLVAGEYKVYFRGRIEGGDVNWAIFKIGSDANQVKAHGRLIDVDQEASFTYDGVAHKSFQFAAGGTGTIIFDYIQLVRVG